MVFGSQGKGRGRGRRQDESGVGGGVGVEILPCPVGERPARSMQFAAVTAVPITY